MKKKHKTQRSRCIGTDHGVVDDWTPLFSAIRDVSEWALDIAAKLSRDYPEDLEAIENVREFVRAWLEGHRSEVSVSDVLTTLAIIFSAIELERGIDSVSLLGPLQTMLDTPSRLPPVLRFPGAARDEKPTVVIRRFPRHRNASAGFMPFAA
jgi:hypothetical protein